MTVPLAAFGNDALPYTIAIDARKLRDFGIGTYVRNLIRELGRLDEENRYLLLVGPRGQGTLRRLPENFRQVVVRSPVYSVRELIRLSWELLRLRVDLYHATHYVLPALVPCKAVVTIHDIIHLLYPEFLPNRVAFLYAQRMIRRSLQRGQRIITVSRNTKDDLTGYFRMEGEKIQVVYNGIEDSFRERLSGEDLDRWMKNLGLERPYFLFVGNPKPHKNLDNVVKAYARALKLHEFPHRLVCVGDRDGVEFKIRQRARQAGLGERLLILGHVAQEALPAIYQGASLFLYPTLYEGFGLPVVEAMASCVPVITSNTSALKEIAAGYAHLVNPLDVEGIAQAIVQCVTDKEHRESLCKLGQRRSQDFRWSVAAEKTLAIYREVLDGTPPES
ncbi:MAG TPA: glycosyltransferase family 1 protein [Thermoanaerobaculia bacterium]|jgi:glycosyltransferase involved in cell wall biosynthesis